MSFFRLPDPRDNIWQFLGTVSGGLLTIIAIVLSVWFFVAERQRKELSYEILSNSAVLVNPAAVGKIEILYNGTPVPDARLTLIRITNSGNVPIISENFEEPLIIESTEGTILSADVTETNPENLLPRGWEPQIDAQAKTVDLPPLLLNDGDYFTIQLLSEEDIDDIDVDARIAGIQDATLYTTSRLSSLELSLFLFLGSLFSLFVFGSWKFLISEGKSPAINNAMTLLTIAVSFLASGMLIYLLMRTIYEIVKRKPGFLESWFS